jgi:NAD dependent epimerase/dehydratase family enzyme
MPSFLHRLLVILGTAVSHPLAARPVPAGTDPALKTVLGEMAQAFLNSHRAVSRRLLDRGLRFEYEQARQALMHIVTTAAGD